MAQDEVRGGAGKGGAVTAREEDGEIRVYSAALVVPVCAAPIPDGAVAVRGGTITHVGERRGVIRDIGRAGGRYSERHWRGALTPGLVNAHTHLQYTGMHRIGKTRHADFKAWAHAFNVMYGPLAAADTPPWREWARMGTEMLLKSGTTAAADIVTDAQAASALHDAGLRGIAYLEVLNMTNADCEGGVWRKALTDGLRGIPKIPGAGISPHAPYSLDSSPLRELAVFARENGLRLHIHLAESPFEKEIDKPEDGHAYWHNYRVQDFLNMRKAGFLGSSIRYVDDLGLLGSDCHAAHGVYANSGDREILRGRNTAMALCPRSNYITGLDAAPVADYLAERCMVAVGTDSLSSSPSLDLMDDVAALAALAKEQGYAGTDLHDRLFYAATIGGAAAMGLGGGIGRLCPGAPADMAFFRVPAPDGGAGVSDAMAMLVEGGGGRCAGTVLGGRSVSGGEFWETPV
jgi:cytosine/adenosine deaminase-related metal-dependent hydrolase